MILAILAALTVGTLSAVSGPINGALSANIGLWGMTAFVSATGLLISAVGLVGGNFSLAKLAETPWYGYLGGLLSVVLVIATVIAVQRIGVANSIVLIIAAQLVVSLLIDSFGLMGQPQLPVSGTKLLGMGIVFLGAYLAVQAPKL